MIDLLHGDCLELLKGIPDGSVDMVLTDPPYGTTDCKWDSVIPLDLMWEQLKRVTKKNGAIVMTAAQPFTSVLGASNISNLRYSWAWKKSRPTGYLNAKIMPMANLEDILVFYTSQPAYNPQGLLPFNKINRRTSSGGCYRASGTSNLQEWTNYPLRLLEFASLGGTVHPTQKPVALMEYLIKTYTNEGGTVLDFTMGCGTTGVACVNTGRDFIGIELDDKYFEIAKGRIAEAQGGKDLSKVSSKQLMTKGSVSNV